MDWAGKFPSKDAKVVFRVIDDQAMVIRIDDKPVGKDEVFVFNPTATRFWELLDGKKKVEEIIDTICAEFEVDHQKAEREISEFISDLSGKKLISFKK